jgi:serine/threonine protein kinase
MDVLETDRHRYVVVSQLAEGGMGATIYLGRRISAGPRSTAGDRRAGGDDVVIKKLPGEHSGDPQLLKLFIREARVSASLRHANIVRMLDLVNAGDDYYMVMEYVRGGDLRTILRRAKRRQLRLTVDSALFVASEVLSALAYAHGKRGGESELGIIHRDVTPSNILLSGDGDVKLTDFGIAKAPTQDSVMFKVKGKLGYMAPEQARGEPVDVRTDIFALGVVLYETLVGERLFAGTMGQAAQVFTQAVRPPSKKRAEIGPEIDEVVLRALALDPAQRFASAQEMRTAIARAAERGRRTLSSAALANDLRRACGEDSANWLSLDVPQTATLDGRGEGTGVILTDEDDDEGEEDRRSRSASRPALLPSKELTSVALFVGNTEADPDHETHVARDPYAVRTPVPAQNANDRLAFTRTDYAVPAAPPRPAPEPSDFDESSEVRTRIASADGSLRRPPLRPPERLPERQPPPPAASASSAARAHFEPPVPRPSVPPPSESSLDAMPDQGPEPTRLSRQVSEPPPFPSASAALPTQPPRPALHASDRPFEAQSEDTARPRAAHRPMGPTSLAALERNLEGRPLARGLLGVALVILLIALGIGLGILLSGPSGDGVEVAPPPSTAAPGAAQ